MDLRNRCHNKNRHGKTGSWSYMVEWRTSRCNQETINYKTFPDNLFNSIQFKEDSIGHSPLLVMKFKFPASFYFTVAPRYHQIYLITAFQTHQNLTKVVKNGRRTSITTSSLRMNVFRIRPRNETFVKNGFDYSPT